MTRYRFRGIFLLFLMGHATACATMTSLATMTSTKPVYGSIPEFIEETQPDRVHITTEDGTVYEVIRPSVEDNVISGDYIVRVGDNPDLRTIPIPLDEIVSLQPDPSESTSLLKKPGNTKTGWILLGILGLGVISVIFSEMYGLDENNPSDSGKKDSGERCLFWWDEGCGGS